MPELSDLLEDLDEAYDARRSAKRKRAAWTDWAIEQQARGLDVRIQQHAEPIRPSWERSDG